MNAVKLIAALIVVSTAVSAADFPKVENIYVTPNPVPGVMPNNIPDVLEHFKEADLATCLDWVRNSEASLRSSGARIYESHCTTLQMPENGKVGITGLVRFF